MTWARIDATPLRDRLRRHSTAELAALLGVSPRTACRLRSARVIGRWTADRVACALGCHPSEWWPDWYQITDTTERRHHR